MFFFTHKIEEATAAGLEQGRAEVYQKWHEDWEKRRQEAIAKGLPFDEPPPPAILKMVQARRRRGLFLRSRSSLL